MIRQPVIDVKLDGLWCSFHAQPWKATWEQHRRAAERAEVTGPLLAGLHVMNALLERPEVARRYDGNIEAFRQEHWTPICCYIAGRDPAKLIAAYRAAGVEPPRREG